MLGFSVTHLREAHEQLGLFRARAPIEIVFRNKFRPLKLELVGFNFRLDCISDIVAYPLIEQRYAQFTMHM